MSSLYHRRGHFRSLFVSPLRHLQRCLHDPAYRALHRFARQTRGLPRFTAGCVRYGGRPIRFVDKASFLSGWDEIFVNRIYDISPAASQPLLVDAGANIGLAALFWKTRFERFEYIGFEPDPNVAACCRENLRVWGVPGQLREAALGASEGRAAYVPDGADGGRVLPASDGGASLDVAIERLSAHVDREIDLLKIDVEGSEGAVLTEVAPKLEVVRNLFVEWHFRNGANGGFAAGLRLLEEAGYRVLVQVAHGPSRPFLERPPPDGCYQQLNIFASRP